MKVRYDENLKIAGIGIHPSMRWGPQMWFKNYQVASLIDDPDWSSCSLEEYAGRGYYQDKHNTRALLHDPMFQDMLKRYFEGYYIMTYKPVIVPEQLSDSGISFVPGALMREISSQFENKAMFRKMFADKSINLPPHDISSWGKLATRTPSEVFAGREKIVLQDATSSGGRGTYIVGDAESLEKVIELMVSLDKQDDQVVVSDFINSAAERSVQGVVTRYGVFVGPVQRQIVAHPQLVDTVSFGQGQFCGVEILQADQQGWLSEKMTANARIIGERLQKSGYRGIFGVDSLVTDNDIYTLEVNARITGATPLLTVNYRPEKGHIPFYLLHILEITGVDYTIEDPQYTNDYDDCALIIPHLLANEPMTSRERLRMGLYDLDLGFIRSGFMFDQSADRSKRAIIQDYSMGRRLVNPGRRLATIFLGRPAIASDGRLDDKVEALVNKAMENWRE